MRSQNSAPAATIRLRTPCASVEFDGPLTWRQSETGTARPGRARVALALEPFEHSHSLRRVDARPGVRHGHWHVLFALGDRDLEVVSHQEGCVLDDLAQIKPARPGAPGARPPAARDARVAGQRQEVLALR